MPFGNARFLTDRVHVFDTVGRTLPVPPTGERCIVEVPGAQTADQITAVLRSNLEPIAQFAIVFGSLTTSRFNQRSDVDCAVLFDKAPSFRECAQLSLDLEQALARDVDIICLNTADIIITMQALANGRPVFARNPGALVLFKAQKIGEYIDFKLSRRVIEGAMLRRAA